MRYIVIALLILFSACAGKRVIVEDCQDLDGSDKKNCLLVEEL